MRDLFITQGNLRLFLTVWPYFPQPKLDIDPLEFSEQDKQLHTQGRLLFQVSVSCCSAECRSGSQPKKAIIFQKENHPS